MNRPKLAGAPKQRAGTADAEVGARVRLRRLEMGMSQSALGKLLGVTFQQVQKYEKGVNRIGAGRLQRIAEVLGKPITFFFPQAENTELAPAAFDQMIGTRLGVDLAKAFTAITRDKRKRLLVKFAQKLAQ